MFPSLARVSLACLSLATLEPIAAHASACDDLKALSLPDTKIDSTATTAAGPYRDGSKYWSLADQLPEHCRVQATIRPSHDSDIKFEVWLPVAAAWNGKLHAGGNGGFAGSINYQSGLAAAVQRGYVGVSTDTGHVGKDDDASWANAHPEKVIDYGHRAVHLATVNAKAILQAYYGKAARRSYFISCSNGGRQALMTAQRYPDDFDGIIAGAPANDWTGLMLSFIWNAQALLKPGAYIPASLAPTIQAGVNAQCDALDGVSDGVVSAPQACNFKPERLLCAPGQSEQCLTAPQVETLRAIYQGPRTAKGVQLFPGFDPGAEAGFPVPGIGWDGWMFGSAAGDSNQGRMATSFMRSMITGNEHWQLTDFDFERDPPLLLEKVGPVLNATDPDLRAFARRGGKLILFHGWADAAIPPRNSIKYFESIGERMGEQQRASFARLFMVPGMQHCLAGPGPSSFGGLTAATQPLNAAVDLSAALEKWVEEGTAPESVRAIRARDMVRALFDPKQADVERSGVICAYPKQAKWNGTGNPADASSYACADLRSGVVR